MNGIDSQTLSFNLKMGSPDGGTMIWLEIIGVTAVSQGHIDLDGPKPFFESTAYGSFEDLTYRRKV